MTPDEDQDYHPPADTDSDGSDEGSDEDVDGHQPDKGSRHVFDFTESNEMASKLDCEDSEDEDGGDEDVDDELDEGLNEDLNEEMHELGDEHIHEAFHDDITTPDKDLLDADEPLYDGNTRPVSEWRRRLVDLDEDVFDRKDYSKGTESLVRMCETEWQS